MAVSSIMVVDDDRDTCVAMSTLIADMGYQVDTAYDGPSGLALLKRHSYDLAILDYNLGSGMNGVDLFRQMKKNGAKTVGILVTGGASSETIEDATAAGIREVIPKPADCGRLIALIKEAAG